MDSTLNFPINFRTATDSRFFTLNAPTKDIGPPLIHGSIADRDTARRWIEADIALNESAWRATDSIEVGPVKLSPRMDRSQLLSHKFGPVKLTLVMDCT
ncbi:hypothetical protein e2017b09.tmp0301 [Eimeria tenella]|uniref:Uncharacterized protein n=1 Tax=Eimeria tenella TaxID=5802 RepID=C8TDY0_EIMTE|nr:hypothetical protein e2017b09.tmp0301 [Eimeria tenella]